MSTASATRALDYLESLPGLTFAKLYAQPSTALAVFRRMLPHLAKTVVMAMLYLPGTMSATDIEAWFKAGNGQAERERALSVLVRLKILVEEQGALGVGLLYRLSPAFAQGLRCALTGAAGTAGGAKKGSFGVACSLEEVAREEQASGLVVDVPFLDAFARRQWEAILYYVVGSANSGLTGENDISQGTKTLLQKGGYVQLKSAGKQRLITQAGFTFLLEEVNAQVWSLAIVYLRMCEEVSRVISVVAIFVLKKTTAPNGPHRSPLLPLHPRLPRTRHPLQHPISNPYSNKHARRPQFVRPDLSLSSRLNILLPNPSSHDAYLRRSRAPKLLSYNHHHLLLRSR